MRSTSTESVTVIGSGSARTAASVSSRIPVPRARPHPDQRRDVIPRERHLVARPRPCRTRLNPVLELPVQPCPLVRVHVRAGPSDVTSSRRCPGAGVTTTSVPPGARIRANSAPLRGANTSSTANAAPVRTGSVPHVSATAAPARGCARAARRAAYLDRSSARPGVRPVARLEHGRQVVPGPRAHVHDHPGVVDRAAHGRRDGARDGLVVARTQERRARLDHPGSVGRTRPCPAREKVHVALPGDVEGMAVVAAQRAVRLPKPARAVRAGKVLDDVREHGRSR